MNEILKQCESAFYVFDLEQARARIRFLRAHLPEGVALCYAVKANTFIIGGLLRDVERFEICSPGEAEICEKLGVPGNMMVISGVYKTPSVMEHLVASGGDRTYTVESLTQFALLRDLAKTYGRTLPVLLRLTNDSQFGINQEDIMDIIRDRAQYPQLDILGIQFFSGTQKTSAKKLCREIRQLDGLLLKLEQEYGYTARELEYGPGFPACYFEDDVFDEETYLADFSAGLNAMESKPHITLELGRGIAARCGRYYTHIVDIKHNKGQNYLLIDGGMHHLVYFGQHMAMKHPFLSVCDKEQAPKTMSWNICGSLCSMNDIVAKQVELPEVSIGDTICFENTGAYCMTEGISLFLSREIPAVYLMDGGDPVCVRQTFDTAPLNTPN